MNKIAVSCISLVIVCLALLGFTGCSLMNEYYRSRAEKFVLAYAQSVSPTVYDTNLKAMQGYLTESLGSKLSKYPDYLEENKRATAEIREIFDTVEGYIAYVDVNISESTQYTIRFEIVTTENRSKAERCDIRILYSRDPVIVN